MGQEATALGREPEAADAPESLCYWTCYRANKNKWERWKPGAWPRPAGRATGKGLEGYGVVWGNWGGCTSLLRAHQKMKWLVRAGTKHGHAPSWDTGPVRVSQHPGQRGGTSIRVPKCRIAASSSRGFAYRPGEQQPPPANKVTSKISQNTPAPSLARRSKEPHGTAPTRWCTQWAAVLETRRTKPWGRLTPQPPKKGQGKMRPRRV